MANAIQLIDHRGNKTTIEFTDAGSTGVVWSYLTHNATNLSTVRIGETLPDSRDPEHKQFWTSSERHF